MPKKKKENLLKKKSLPNYVALAFVLVFSVFGGYYVFQSRAASEEAYKTIWTNRASTTLQACRFHAAGYWRVKMRGTKTTNASRIGIAYKVSDYKIIARYNFKSASVESIYGTATTGYIKFYLEGFGGDVMSKFKDLPVC